MFNSIFGPKVHYIGDSVNISIDDFRANKFVEASAGSDAFWEYVELRVAGKPQLDSFINAFGRIFCGKPDALTKAAEAFETTPDYRNAYTDAANLVASLKAKEARRIANENAAMDARRSGKVEFSDDTEREDFHHFQERLRTEAARRAEEHARIEAAVNNDNGFYFAK